MSIDSTLTRRMTSARVVRPKKEFVPAILPWVVAGATLLVYLVTLNHWVSLSSLERTARVSGWLWQPEAMEPLYWLITYPIHWLPLKLIPVALNILSAVCGTLTLGLLARSVALLPHDRTEAQRNREKNAFGILTIRFAWVPPVLAALVCGLQLSFWENATVASGEIFNLLLFAYIIRCLLEYRVDSSESWLFRASLIYGAAMANNWAMIPFFPVFLVALIWLRGVNFFNTRFLLRMFLLGVAGLSLYLLLPFIATVTGNKDMNFWQALKANLGTQGLWVRQLFRFGTLFRGEQPLWVLALPSLLPILALSLRWPAYFGDPSRLGVALTTFILHFMHGVLLVLCLWVALDPAKFGPRHLNFFGQQSPFPMLTLYYLGALSIGYFIGYFLLVFGAEPVGRPRFVSLFGRLRSQVIVGGVSSILVATAFLLVVRNVPQIRTTNGPMLRLYARSLTERLPKQGAVTLSDFPMEERARMLLVQADLAQEGARNQKLTLDTEWLYSPSYHRTLKKRYGSRWPFDLPSGQKPPLRFTDVDVWSIVVLLSKTNQVYYLHPSFGYFFESFYLEPHGLVYKLDQYPTNALLAPKLSKETIDENEAFWNRTDDSTIKPLLQASSGTAAHQDWLGHVEERLHLTREANPTAVTLSSFYSLALNYWGVQLQRNSRIAEAGLRFQRALDLNSENLAAQVNLECNRNLGASKPARIQLSKGVVDRLGSSRYRGRWEGETLEAVMHDCGPFDEPLFCFKLAGLWAFPPSGLRPQYHQAALNFARAAELAPDSVEPLLHLAETSVYANLPDEALKIIDSIHARARELGLNRTNAPMLLAITMAAHLSKTNVESAVQAAQTALQKEPDNFELLSAASRMYITYRSYSNALESIDAQLKVRPGDPNALYAKGLSQLGLNQTGPAIDTFSRVVELETNRLTELSYMAKWYRAQACIDSGKLNQAQADYETLQKDFPTDHGLYRALGDLFYTKKDTNAAIRNYQLYKAGMTNADELKFVNARLKELKPAPR